MSRKFKIVVLILFLGVFGGCSVSGREQENTESYKVSADQIKYDASAVPLAQISYPIDPTMVVLVKNNDQVTTETALYDTLQPDAAKAEEKARFDLGLQYSQLDKLNQEIAKSKKDDPILSQLNTEKSALLDQIKSAEFALENGVIDSKTYAKFNGNVIIDQINGRILLRSNEYGILQVVDFETLQTLLKLKPVLELDGKTYNLKIESYLPNETSLTASGTTDSTKTTFNVNYKIENLDKKIIDGQPLVISVTQNIIYVPDQYLVEEKSKQYLKVNGTTTEVKAVKENGRLIVTSGVKVGDEITNIGADDAIFK
ncbi:MAG: hypothetical protein ACRCUP_07295 [Mycoplasmatales bacterium]